MSLAPRIDALDRPNLRASEGAGTTALIYPTDSLWQIFNLSAARTVVLPSANILVGQKVRLDSVGNFDLTVKSSDTTTITVLNAGAGSTGDPTIQNGYVEAIALQNTPTAPSHWRILHVEEVLGILSGTTSGGAIAVAYSAIPTRRNSIATVFISSITASASASTDISIDALATRFRPPVARRSATEIQSNNVPQAGVGVIGTDGVITFRRFDGSNHTGVTGLGGAANLFTSLYYWLK